MTIWRTYLLFAITLGSACAGADSAPGRSLTDAEYKIEIQNLLVATEQLDSSSSHLPAVLQTLPQSWSVHTSGGDFEISTEGLRRDVRRYKDDQSEANAIAIRSRIEALKGDIEGFERPPADVSGQRVALGSILARREFADVRGPGWTDRLKQWALQKLISLLSRIFRSSAIPTVGKYFVYSLIGFAGVALLYLVYRSMVRESRIEEVVPKNLPVSAKEWTIWLSEAREAGDRGEWRDAIHMGYWAGISFLEQQGFWKPDRARTPREYLRLISNSNAQHETLTVLTRILELAWYARRDASETTFSQTLEQLERLGCR